MALKQCYGRIGNYDEALHRLGNEDFIRKYLEKFSKDETFPALCEAMKKQDIKQAFLYAHNLKGLYLNLAMSRAAASSSRLCEALRANDPKGEGPALLEALKKDHEEILLAIAEMKSESGGVNLRNEGFSGR